jgi:hypothetical protein
MITQFRTASSTYIFDAPWLGSILPPDATLPSDLPGASMFLAALGGALEAEEEHLRSRLLQFAMDLETALEQSDFKSKGRVPKYLAALRSLIEFLQSAGDNSVCLYSYERTPSISDLLDAFPRGSGAKDWALEELGKKGEKGRKAMLSVLKKEKNRGRLLSAVSMLLLLFRDEKTIAAVQQFTETCDADTGKVAAVLLAAYTLG